MTEETATEETTEKKDSTVQSMVLMQNGYLRMLDFTSPMAFGSNIKRAFVEKDDKMFGTKHFQVQPDAVKCVCVGPSMIEEDLWDVSILTTKGVYCVPVQGKIRANAAQKSAIENAFENNIVIIKQTKNKTGYIRLDEGEEVIGAEVKENIQDLNECGCEQ